MTYDLLKDLRIVEISAFVAAPLAGLTLAQLGAEVIRIDPPGGGIDNARWPLAADGSSLYWHGLNRAKKSVFADLKCSEGQRVFRHLLNTNGDAGGIVLTNLGGLEYLSFDALKKFRKDVILVELTGHSDGDTAVDYTVNAAVGVPLATGPEHLDAPVNHMLPAWDGMAGLTLSTAVLAALRARDQTAKPQHVSVALSDVAVGFLGNLGILADAEINAVDRARHGNYVYGTFGHSLQTSDGRYFMVVAMTRRHWTALVNAAGIEKDVEQLERKHNLNLYNESDRYRAKNDICELLAEWSNDSTFSEVSSQLDRYNALWGPYQTFRELLQDKKLVTDNPLIQSVSHPTIGTFRVPGSTIRFDTDEGALSAGPVPGSDTDSVLQELEIPLSHNAPLTDGDTHQ